MTRRLACAVVTALLLASPPLLGAQIGPRGDSIRAARRDSAAARLARFEARRESLPFDIEQRIARSGATAGVYYADLREGRTAEFNADARFHAASTMKVAVMLQVYRDVDAGRLALRQRIPVVNSFRSLVGDTLYELSAADDSDSSLYARVGQAVELERLLELMIQVSSNLATNILIAQVGAERVQQTLAELGIDSMRVLRGVEDGPAYRAGLNNTVTARSLGQLFAAIADGRAASAVSCGHMLRVLLGQQDRTAIRAGLPRRTRVAHKTGYITALRHDGGIVYHDDQPRYVLVALTRGLADQNDADALIADIARLTYDATIPPSSR